MYRIFQMFIVGLLVMLSVVPAMAASKLTFNKSVQQNGVIFDISSRAAFNYAAQIVTITARRGSKKIAALKSDVDHAPQTAEAVDLDGGGTPELVVISKAGGTADAETLDVYWLSGTVLNRATLQEPEDKSGYRGGDRFHREENLLVRTVPIYRNGDAAGKPSGGTRELKYEFKTGVFTLYVQTEKVEAAVETAPVAAAPALATAPAATTNVAPVAAASAAEPATAPVISAPAAPAPAAVPAEPAIAPSAPVAAPPVPAPAVEAVVAPPAAAAVVAPVVPEQPRTVKPAKAGKPAISSVTANDDGIVIVTSTSPLKYRTMRLDKPERIAIDFPGADSALAGRKITINRFGISKARVGRNKGFLRIVLDTTEKKFPAWTIKQTETGVLVEFSK
jgi:hypothetical protein